MRDAVAFAWRAMDAFYEEDERILGHAADPYHRIDIRRSSRHLVVQDGDQVVADTQTPLVLYESGFAPRWYVPRADIVVEALQLVEGQTFCPYKGLASYYNVGDARNAAWSYRAPVEEVEPIADLLSFYPEKLTIMIDGEKLEPVPGQNVLPHGPDRNLSVDEIGGIQLVEDRSHSSDVSMNPRPHAEASPAGRPVGTLLSVNVGMPKDVPWQGKTVFTGVFKEPVTGPRRVRKLNVDGDGQGDLAGHGGEQRAVFVYQIDSYRYWERELGRNDFVYGQFGENFTVDGLGDDEVCIGDRYRIGTAVFEVTQPRVTCYRVGIRMNDPRIPALLVSHRRPGFYFRVLEEGEVQAGDEIIKLASGPEQMTVAEVDALLYLPGHPRQQLLRALRIPALSPGWQASFRALLEGEPGSGNAGLSAASPPPAWPGFRRLTVTGIERESDR